MKKHLRLFSWILSLTLLCELLPIAAFAQSDVGEAAAVTLATLLEETNSTESTGKCGDNLTYTLSADGVLTISGTGEMYDFATIESQISDTVKECPWKRENLKKIILNEGVTSIGSQAFCVDPYQGSPLDTVILPDSLLSIGNNAFLNCNHLDAITLPNHLTSIGASAFQYSSLSSVNIPASVTNWGDYAFAFSSLSDVTLSEGLSFLGSFAFYYCEQLHEIKFPQSLTVISSNSFPYSGLSTLTIPETVTEIGFGAFNHCNNLTSVVVPDSVTSIGGLSFAGCSNLSSLTLPVGLTTITEVSFGGCNKLTTIDIPNSVTHLDWKSFAQCGFKTLVLPDSITSTDSHVFSDSTNLTSIVLSKGLTAIAQNFFEDCTNLSWVFIPASITSIQKEAFLNCDNLTDIYYSGTKEQWASVVIESDNIPLTTAAIHCIDDEDTPERTFEFKKDNLSFLNSPKYFFKGKELEYWHYVYKNPTVEKKDFPKEFKNVSNEYGRTHISQDKFNQLTRNLSPNVLSWFHLTFYGKRLIWGGSCYGMVATTAIHFMDPNRIPLSSLSSTGLSDSDSPYELPAPVDNTEVENLINYYFMSQRLPTWYKVFSTYLYNCDHNFEGTLNELIQSLSKGIPVMALTSDHCVLLVNIKGTYSDHYVLGVYDPNEEEEQTMTLYKTPYINDENETYLKISYGKYDYLQLYILASDLNLIDVRNYFDPTSDNETSTDYNDAHISVRPDQNSSLVIGGQYYYRAKDGSILERDPNVLIVRLTNQLEDDSSDDSIELLFPKPSATEDIKLELSSNGVNNASMILNNSTLAVSASGPVELIYNEQTQTVDLTAAEPTDISLMVTQNDTSSTWPWHSWALDTTGTTTLHAELDNDGLHLNGNGLTNAEYATKNEITEKVDSGTIPTQPNETTGITAVTIINKEDASGDDKTEIVTPGTPNEPNKPTPTPDPTPTPTPDPTPTPNPDPTPNPTPSSPTTPTTTSTSGGDGGGAALILGAGAVALTAGLVLTAPVAVQGNVEFSDHTAVPGAKIALLQNGNVVAQTTADENGAFVLKVKRGNYELTAAYTDANGQLHHQTLSIKAPAKDLTITF